MSKDFGAGLLFVAVLLFVIASQIHWSSEPHGGGPEQVCQDRSSYAC